VVDLPRERDLAGLLAAAAHEGLVNGAHDVSDGGVAMALVDGCLRFGVGARVWLDELLSRDGIDATTALFSETGGRIIVAVPREEDVKFTRLCEGRGYPVARIGVTDDGAGAEPVLEIQDVLTISLTELRATSRAPLARFA
jgi:phosphoribosylformylglycinamidine synthase